MFLNLLISRNVPRDPASQFLLCVSYSHKLNIQDRKSFLYFLMIWPSRRFIETINKIKKDISPPPFCSPAIKKNQIRHKYCVPRLLI